MKQGVAARASLRRGPEHRAACQPQRNCLRRRKPLFGAVRRPEADGMTLAPFQDAAVATYIDYLEANTDLCRKPGLPGGSGTVESACKHIVGSRFKRTPTPRSPSTTASRAIARPTSSIGGIVPSLPHDQKHDSHPTAKQSLNS